MRTLDIVELLRNSRIPLKINEISSATKIPRATTYRILRTLVYRGYAFQDVECRFTIQNQAIGDAILPPINHARTLATLKPSQSQLSGEEVIDVVQDVLHSLRQGRERNNVRRVSQNQSDS